jgi:cysteine-rich repeat protein
MTCYGAAGYFITPLDTCATCNVTYCTTCIGYSSCQVCNSGYGVTITGSCSTCPLDGCQTCANLTTCSLCIGEYLSIGGLCYSCPVTCTCGGYTLPKYTNGDCATICGDGIVLGPYETCDDGNLVNGDGCSSTCKIEDSSVCSGEPSTCYLNKDLQVSFVRSEVSPTSCNLITFTFQIQPALSVLNTLNISWNGFITSNSSYLSMQGSPTYSNAVLKLTYMYNSTIQSQLVVFNVNVQSIRNASTYLSQIHNTSLQVQVQPTNNLAAVYCSSAVKTQAFGYGISAVGYLGMLLSIFSCKIVGL